VRNAYCLFILGTVLAGCTTIRVSGPRDCKTVGEWSYEAWDKVLGHCVVEGLVNYEALKADTRHLERFVAQLGCFGPALAGDQFPDRKSQLAYWINAHNAISMLAAVKKYPCQTVSPAFGEFGRQTQCWVDGRYLSLSDIARLALEAAGDDPRVRLALILPAKGSGKLPDTPILPEKIDTQLTDLVREALNDPAIVKIDHENLTLLLGKPVYDARDQYLKHYRKTYRTDSGTIINALGFYGDARQRRTLNRAIGYQIRLMPFDWSLNEWSRPKCSLD